MYDKLPEEINFCSSVLILDATISSEGQPSELSALPYVTKTVVNTGGIEKILKTTQKFLTSFIHNNKIDTKNILQLI